MQLYGSAFFSIFGSSIGVGISARSLAVNMYKKIILDSVSEGIQYDVDPFSACQLSSRNKIGIASNQYNLVNLLFVSKRGNIHAYFHVDTFLFNRRREISFG